jgi:hypothetical protein
MVQIKIFLTEIYVWFDVYFVKLGKLAKTAKTTPPNPSIVFEKFNSLCLLN